MIPRRGFIFKDDDCNTAQFIINPLRGMGALGRCFYGYIFPTGKMVV
jgi:hypothetical protein